jgi:hypothetical protein
MRPADAEGATLSPPWHAAAAGVAAPPGRWRRAAGLSRRARLAGLAAAMLLVALGAAAYVSEAPRGNDPAAPASTSQGTALLGTATCADWQAAGAARRLTIVQSLAAAATQPDPENPGATLSQGTAYGLFERVCATGPSRSVLLYEAYNRAASMSAAPMASRALAGPTQHP